MDAVITPNRSLTPKGLKAIMIATVAFSLLPVIMFLRMGAHFAPMFMGVDILGLWWALTVATRDDRKAERVQVSGEDIRVLRGRRGHEKRVWSSPTAFTRIEVEGEEEEVRVRLSLSAKSLVVAASLSPSERRDFAEALREAVRQARLERHPH